MTEDQMAELPATWPHFGACSCDYRVVARSQKSVGESLRQHVAYVRADPVRAFDHPPVGPLTVYDVPEEPIS